ncbi:hypothetical protein [Vibrio phage vB_pir03]|nr:hypothetical protein [Vibrio phage vB_pir03]
MQLSTFSYDSFIRKFLPVLMKPQKALELGANYPRAFRIKENDRIGSVLIDLAKHYYIITEFQRGLVKARPNRTITIDIDEERWDSDEVSLSYDTYARGLDLLLKTMCIVKEFRMYLPKEHGSLDPRIRATIYAYPQAFKILSTDAKDSEWPVEVFGDLPCGERTYRQAKEIATDPLKFIENNGQGSLLTPTDVHEIYRQPVDRIRTALEHIDIVLGAPKNKTWLLAPLTSVMPKLIAAYRSTVKVDHHSDCSDVYDNPGFKTIVFSGVPVAMTGLKPLINPKNIWEILESDKPDIVIMHPSEMHVITEAFVELIKKVAPDRRIIIGQSCSSNIPADAFISNGGVSISDWNHCHIIRGELLPSDLSHIKL